MLFVHAHPDDETINNGATMARYAADGVQVALVTCTRGEQGEVIPPRLVQLAATGRLNAANAVGKDGADNTFADLLGDHRVGELATAMAALGVHDHRFLGDPHTPGRRAAQALADGGKIYRDSGMAYDATGAVVPSLTPPPGAFALADVEVAAGLLAEVIRELRPQVVVTYGPDGGYGHPDHVRTHQVTMRAIELVNVPKVYWTVNPTQADQAGAAVDARTFTAAKIAALQAHETQLTVAADGRSFALSNGVAQPLTGLECYRLVRGTPSGSRDALGRETDLLAGVPR